MKKFMKLAAALALPVLAMAEPIPVNLGDASASVGNAGFAMIGIAVIMLGFGLVIAFIRRGR